MSSLKKFFVHYSHFVTGSALSLLLGLISFPILTRILTREEYGVMGLVTTTMLLTVAVAKAGLSDGIIRFYKEYGDQQEKRTIFSSTIAVRGIILAVTTVLLYVIIFPIASRYLHISSKFLTCFMIMSAYLLLRPLNIIVLNLLRITDKTIFYNVINLMGRVISIAASLFLLLYLIGELYGYFIGLVLAELTVSVVLFYWFLANYKIALSKVSGDLALKLIRFGVPLLITEMSYLLLSYADRYMIVAFNGEDALGLYSVGYNLASYISDMVMFPLSYAVIPIYVGIYEKEGKEKTEDFLEKCLHYLLIAIIPLCAGYFVIARDLFVTLASEKYISAASFSPVILLGSLFLGINSILNAGLYLQKRSMSILAIMLSALVVNIILNLLLLPVYGAFGAAIATLAACLVSTVMTTVLSFRHICIRINLGTIFFYTLISAIMYFVLNLITTPYAWANLLIKVALGMLMIAPVVLLKEKEVFEKVKGMLPFKKVIL
jgi:O-antigen/teichoic acid export membrane protein